jgi:hypothetical protein
MKVVVVEKQRAAAPLLPIRDIVAARATIVLPRLLQQGNGSRAIAVNNDVSIIIQAGLIGVKSGSVVE